MGRELKRAGWHQADLQLPLKGDPAKPRIAARVRRETTLSIWDIANGCTWVAAKARARLHKFDGMRKIIDEERKKMETPERDVAKALREVEEK